MIVRTRIINIVRRMLAGDAFYTSAAAPRISNAEIAEMEALGFALQTQAGSSMGSYAAGGGGQVVYALDKAKFKKHAIKLGIK